MMKYKLVKLLAFTFFIGLCISQAFGQDNEHVACEPFILDVHLTHLDTGNLILFYPNCETTAAADTQRLVNGRVTFRGKINRAAEAQLYINPDNKYLNGSGLIPFVLEACHMFLNGEVNQSIPCNIQINGSKSQYQKERWDAENYSVQKEIIDIKIATGKLQASKKKYGRTIYNNQLALLREKYGECYNKVFQNCYHFIQAHPNSYFSSYLLYSNYVKMPVDSLRKYYSMLSPPVRNCSMGQIVLKYLDTLSNQSGGGTITTFPGGGEETTGPRKILV